MFNDCNKILRGLCMVRDRASVQYGMDFLLCINE